MSIKVFLTISLCALTLSSQQALAQTGSGKARAPFVLSPPAPGKADQTPKTDLRELRDAHGLALLVEDDRAAKLLEAVLGQWEKQYEKVLGGDKELKGIESRAQGIFIDNLNGRREPLKLLNKRLMAIPKEQHQRTLTMWLKNLFFRRDVFFSEDLDRADKNTLSDICQQTRAFDRRKNLPNWRKRVLLWRWRDTEVGRLFAEYDERLAVVSPIQLDGAKLKPATRRALKRYLAMLRNLKLEVLRNRDNPYETHRTLRGVLRGLRYMKTIRESARITGLDHRMMAGLYIQESEFIHRRVSVAGAFSIAQFLNIAVKDVWLFKNRIPGSKTLLRGVKSWEDLKAKMIADPRMAIKTSCLYFRRVRDGIARYLARGGNAYDSGLADLLTLEMVTLRRGAMQRSAIETYQKLNEFWPARSILPLPMVPIGGAVVPEPATMLEAWADRTIREMVAVRISEKVFEERLVRLQSALGLASYNAGTGTLLKTGKRKHPYQALSFPLHIDETRGYVDSIMDAWDILDRVDRLASGVSRMAYSELIQLGERACRMSHKKLGPKAAVKKSSPPTR